MRLNRFAPKAGKLVDEFGPAFFNQRRKFGIMIGKIEEGRGSSEFLPLEQHGRGRTQQQGRHRTALARMRHLMNAPA